MEDLSHHDSQNQQFLYIKYYQCDSNPKKEQRTQSQRRYDTRTMRNQLVFKCRIVIALLYKNINKVQNQNVLVCILPGVVVAHFMATLYLKKGIKDS
jgi:hypothetical protein